VFANRRETRERAWHKELMQGLQRRGGGGVLLIKDRTEHHRLERLQGANHKWM
jgi:hypothetical protein